MAIIITATKVILYKKKIINMNLIRDQKITGRKNYLSTDYFVFCAKYFKINMKNIE